MDTINLITRVSREKEPDAHESFLKLRGKERGHNEKKTVSLAHREVVMQRNKETSGITSRSRLRVAQWRR